ncbi:MAG: diphosphomevalonate decarboxylase [Chloroflexi bacterium AL-W]|nr:diphosphomevalonate decarboxylase [Chloroflexi bacterium AL-N1]NOK65106.1 diphosphomevalonate decarboxylase [Chloroflexi bacterium AL-N10]NOK72627.1 diphosphomevalonate decarboxylase [Chloroflexi bacterium AL-N5]NOK79285.1 diphosphomevalonate decarboxylase [Chloroflexi bacterium AL-W]NOK87201.1 diphosphomevalonate decarboxylase [Chloroflexi bacterium AL-N15]
MKQKRATAIAPANIAFIKYWGVRDTTRTLPYNGSISMNLDACLTTTTVTFDENLTRDEITLTFYQQAPHLATGVARERVVVHLERLRALAGTDCYAKVISSNNFPSDAGIASSAAGFAALTRAGVAALGLELDERQLSLLARRSGSGSACRSIPSGYVEWYLPSTEFDLVQWDQASYAKSIAQPEHWDLTDVVAVVDTNAKKIGSAENHRLATSSPYFATRLAEIPDRLAAVREAIVQRDFTKLGQAMEADAVSMHAVCMTSHPPSFYWNGGTMNIIHAVRSWRSEGLEAYFTIDAGPNVHVICETADSEVVAQQLRQLPGVEFTIANMVGKGTRLEEPTTPDVE